MVLNEAYNYIESLENLLEREVIDFVNQVDIQNEKKKEEMGKVYLKISESIRDTLNVPFELSTYGSFANGLNLPWSDIDLLLEVFCDFEMDCFELLETAFLKNQNFIEVKFIKNTSVPVLKLTSNLSSDPIKIDITMKDVRHSGLTCVNLVRQYLISYPALRPIALVLKHLLYTGKLNDPFQKGLSSYGLILMIVSYFQWLVYNDAYSNICANLGRTLYNILKHYGSYFDYINWKIVPSAALELVNPYVPVF